jgi:leucyl aminopeptidase (aminopeptidase T)
MATVGVAEAQDTATRTGRYGHITKTCYKLMKDYAGLKEGESVAIIIDTETSPMIGEAIAAATLILGGTPITVLMPPGDVHGSEPPKIVAAAMAAADVIIAPVSISFTHTKAIRNLFTCPNPTVRYIGMSSITEDAMIRGACRGDMEEVKRIGESVAKVLRTGKKVRITSEYGTDVTFDLDNSRPVKACNGIARNPGEKTMFPDGEVWACPIEESWQGVVFIDNWLQGIGLIEDKPIRWELKNGRCISITGGTEAARLRNLLETEGDENSYYIGEFAIGTNPEARISGNPHREGKKIYGSAHIALGSGISYGGKLRSTLHLDGILLRPVVYVDGRKIMENGKILTM